MLSPHLLLLDDFKVLYSLPAFSLPAASLVSTHRQSDLFNITNLSMLQTLECFPMTFRTKIIA